ncbi:MAG: YIP1 family protein [Ignavibacteria bacterium]|jgi:hypothetical protein
MEEMKNQVTEENQETSEQEDYQLSHTDKLVGVFTEPGKTFSQMAKFPAKATDWFFPLLIVVIVAFLANVLMMSNPRIKYSIIEKQMKGIEKRMNDMVENGQLSRAQADEQIERTRDFMENQQSTQMVFTAIGIVGGTFIIFFIIALFYWLLAKFVLKGDGGYSQVLSAYGLSSYITAIQIVAMVILAFAAGRFFQGTSLAAILESDTSTLTGFLLSKADVFSIWFYAVVSVGLAKMFKSESTGKYYIMVFALWLLGGLLFFYISQAVPFLRAFTGG